MEIRELQLSVRLSSARKPIGIKLALPPALAIVRGPPGSALHAEERQGGKLVGDIDLSVITPGLIVDRDGVLREAAGRVADAFVAPPRDGWLLNMGEVQLPGGPAWRAEAYMQRDRDGHVPALPFQTVLAMGHPDLVLPLALFVTIRSLGEDWPPAAQILESIQFLGAPAKAAVEAQVLPLTF